MTKARSPQGRSSETSSRSVLVFFWVLPLLIAGCRTSAPEFSAWKTRVPAAARVSMPEWMVYDAAVADSVQARWYQLMDARPAPPDSGRVVLEFLLRADGSISDLFVADNTEGEILATICQKALLDPTPFGAWSGHMQAMFGGARRFRMKFEFDALGVGYLDYSEAWTELARDNRAPAETTIVLDYRRGEPLHSVLPN